MAGKNVQSGQRYVALLRGINVGGRNVLRMKDLLEMFQSVGCKNVETYIQSGNVIFSAGSILAKRAAAMVTAALLANDDGDLQTVFGPSAH